MMPDYPLFPGTRQLQGLVSALFVLLCVCGCARLTRASTLEELWNGSAHFKQVGEIDWTKAPRPQSTEEASWFAVRGGTWYAFNRVASGGTGDHCPVERMRVIVRQSRDQGRSWSDWVSAVVPGDSARGDGCAIVDGSSYFDAPSHAWHMLAQCLDKDRTGGWALCHYVRKAASPMGRFVADTANPVVRGGDLWSRICTGTPDSCPRTTVDEGTPEVVTKTDGRFLVTFHGFDPASDRGYRGVAATADFRAWQVKGAGLPGAPILGPADCAAWLSGCVGSGAASMLMTSRFTYVLVETMDKSLMCLKEQQWVFQLLRAPKGPLPASGKSGWQRLGDRPFLTPSASDVTTRCKVQYARWIVDGGHVFIVYEDWLPGRQQVHRRLLALLPGKETPTQRQ